MIRVRDSSIGLIQPIWDSGGIRNGFNALLNPRFSQICLHPAVQIIGRQGRFVRYGTLALISVPCVVAKTLWSTASAPIPQCEASIQSGFASSRIIDLDSMRTLGQQLVLVLVLAAAFGYASAQAPDRQYPGIDPALLAKANAGDAAALVLVGENYVAGKAVALDLRQAAEWYRKAADKGDLAGELHLAALYRDGGKGFARDMEQAAAWYRKAAEQGDAGAQATLGLLYSLGQGLPRDYVEAYFWLDLAASVKGPKQEQYTANRQLIGRLITTGDLEEIEERVARWQAAHPRPAAPK